MKKFLYSLLLSFLMISTHLHGSWWGKQCKSHSLACIHIVDRNGFTETMSVPDRLKRYENVNFLAPQPYEKVMRVYHRDCQGNVLSLLTAYYENGQIKQYLEILNGRASGNYYEWHKNGQVKLQAYVVGGEADFDNNAPSNSWLFDGHSQVWDEEGHLIADIIYEKGILEGEAKYYHSSGNLWKYIPYHNNEIEGEAYIFLDNEQLLQISHFVEGARNGETLRYWAGEQLAAKEEYDKGILRTGVYYTPSGELFSTVNHGSGYRAVFGKDFISELHQYQGGIPHGEVKYFNQSGDYIRTYHVNKEEVKHGEDIEYYAGPPANRPKLLMNWVEGRLQGEVKTWYPNGALESHKELHNNKKHGLLTAWYSDGSLMLIEEYDKDKLVKGEYFKKGEGGNPASKIYKGEGIALLYDGDGNFVNRVKYKNGKPQI